MNTGQPRAQVAYTTPFRYSAFRATHGRQSPPFPAAKRGKVLPDLLSCAAQHATIFAAVQYDRSRNAPGLVGWSALQPQAKDGD